MRAMLTAITLAGAFYVLSALAPSGVALSAEPADHDHTHTAATSPDKAERAPSAASMAELMQQMNSQSAKGAMSSQMMGTRMDMMTMMMQMMMDGHQMGSTPMSGMPMGATPPTPIASPPPSKRTAFMSWQTVLYFLLWAGAFALMMRFGCGAT